MLFLRQRVLRPTAVCELKEEANKDDVDNYDDDNNNKNNCNQNKLLQ